MLKEGMQVYFLVNGFAMSGKVIDLKKTRSMKHSVLKAMEVVVVCIF